LAVNVPWTDTNTQTVSSVNGKTGAVSLSASDVGALSTAGGTLTGNLTGKYITGTWLQTTSDNALGSAATHICVQNNGWIYTRTSAQIRNDIGAAPTYSYGTESLVSGETPLETGKLHFVYT
jgi:hypothetical protein